MRAGRAAVLVGPGRPGGAASPGRALAVRRDPAPKWLPQDTHLTRLWSDALPYPFGAPMSGHLLLERALPYLRLCPSVYQYVSHSPRSYELR